MALLAFRHGCLDVGGVGGRHPEAEQGIHAVIAKAHPTRSILLFVGVRVRHPDRAAQAEPKAFGPGTGVFHPASLADAGVDPTTVLGRELVGIEREELLVRGLVAQHPIQEEVPQRRWALPTGWRFVDRLRGVEDRFDVVREFLVAPGQAQHQFVTLAAGVGRADEPVWMCSAQETEKLCMEVDRRATEDGDLDRAIADPSQLLLDLAHVLPHLGQRDSCIGSDRDAHPAVPTPRTGQLSQ